ncbi:MAG TPA: GYF domain-containing protein [Opitutaceae bacterium]|nr:GYF domain-containing protein [Opitutaceae bacterium]
MFKILGADGREYGPVPADQITKWIGEGRADQRTLAQPAGETTWKPLSQFPEFASIFAPTPPVVTPGGATAAVLPTAAPSAPSAPGADAAGARARALDLVSGPAIGLIVTGILGISAGVLGILWLAFMMGSAPALRGMTPEAARMFQLLMGPVGIAARVVGIIASIFILIGALRMQKLANYGLAMTAAIVAMVPCLSPCCVIGLPIGIWALVVLVKPEVKSQFG